MSAAKASPRRGETAIWVCRECAATPCRLDAGGVNQHPVHCPFPGPVQPRWRRAKGARA